MFIHISWSSNTLKHAHGESSSLAINQLSVTFRQVQSCQMLILLGGVPPPYHYGWHAHLQNLARQFFRAQFYIAAIE